MHQKFQYPLLAEAHLLADAFKKGAMFDFCAKLMQIHPMLHIDGILMKNLLPATTPLKW